MTLSHDFDTSAQGQASRNPDTNSKSKYPPPFSLRLTFEEREKLEELAAGMTLAAYIRLRLFAGDVSPRRTKGLKPVKDHTELGRVLAALGASRLSSNLNQLAHLANIGSLPVTPDTEGDLRAACADVREIRLLLLSALGKQPGGSS